MVDLLIRHWNQWPARQAKTASTHIVSAPIPTATPLCPTGRTSNPNRIVLTAHSVKAFQYWKCMLHEVLCSHSADLFFVRAVPKWSREPWRIGSEAGPRARKKKKKEKNVSGRPLPLAKKRNRHDNPLQSGSSCLHLQVAILTNTTAS